MENQISCPRCKRTISNNPVIDIATRGENPTEESRYIMCECGERISFWAITAQLRDKQKPVEKLRDWFRNLSRSKR